jgi:hypothetical protein
MPSGASEADSGWELPGWELSSEPLIPDEKTAASALSKLSEPSQLSNPHRLKAENQTRGVSYSPLSPTSETVASNAGVDSARFLFRIEGGDVGAARSRIAWSGGQLQAVDPGSGELFKTGMNMGFTEIAGGPAVWVEGRPIQVLTERGRDELLSPTYLPVAEHTIREHLKRLDINAAPAGCSRLDLTTTANTEGTLSDRNAILRGVAALKVNRRKTEVIYDNRSRRLETVYLIGLGKRGSKHERVYAESLMHKDSSESAVRFEAQTRHSADKRRTAEAWTPELCASVFNDKFSAVGAAAEGLTMASTWFLHGEIAKRVAANEMTVRQAERLMGFLGAKQAGIELPRSTRYRREAELASYGLALSIPEVTDKTWEKINLQEVFEEITSSVSWN